ncbi:hypothetical protein WOLCODRAFT_103794 [Wolfiporia cocos MD-104 SS10]|uniref:DUF218 domain-containing protein n=1 Tax=Wolfiporia cocos (strain MD-104) TaxID=742152 RepID=A0A2H3JUC8_WOLCO|nr:hypothetical protein WOLCODRAFT_103794 [Wolfiporia cocos MD-104 SS10]
MLPLPASYTSRRQFSRGGAGSHRSTRDVLLTRARITNLGLLLLSTFAIFSFLVNLNHYYTSPRAYPHADGEPFGIVETIQRDETLSTLDHLIIVPGHAIWIGIDPAKRLDDNEWILEPYQRGGGRVAAFYKHIATAAELSQQDDHALVVFSGGQTRRTSTTTEGESYMRLALTTGALNASAAPLRATTEDFALDSYQNLLFSIARFHEYTGRYPVQITVIGYGFKSQRFNELHRAALRWPRARFHYVGIDAEGEEHKKALEGERLNGYIPYTLDTYGCHDLLRSKRRTRNPFIRYHSYYTSSSELAALFDWCPGDRTGGQTTTFDGPLPWDYL